MVRASSSWRVSGSNCARRSVAAGLTTVAGSVGVAVEDGEDELDGLAGGRMNSRSMWIMTPPRRHVGGDPVNDRAVGQHDVRRERPWSTRTVWRRCWLSQATAVATPRMTMLKQIQIRFITMVPGWLPS